MIKGITVRLYERTQTGTDDFNRPVYTETAVDVPDVLVAPISATEVIDTLNLTGKRAVYNLALPKGDAHEWNGCKVEFFGQTFRAFRIGTRGIEENIPLRWNEKIAVERYE